MGLSDSAAGLTLTLLHHDPAWIRAAAEAGVERIGLDIERLHKERRQRSVADARIQQHELSDFLAIETNAPTLSRFARLNPWHPGSAEEIEQALSYGTTSLMLPYFRSVDEPAAFIQQIAGRARVVLLFETFASVVRIHEVLQLEGISEVMVGMNDLHLESQLHNPFEICASPLMDMIAAQVHARGLTFGFGAVAALTDSLPVSPDLLLARMAQLGVTSTWISRSLLKSLAEPKHLSNEIERIRQRFAYWKNCPVDEREKALRQLRKEVFPNARA
jgi:hypothetical protein